MASSRQNIRVEPLTPNLVDQAHAAYALAVSHVPHCYPVDRAPFAAAMLFAGDAAELSASDGNGAVHDEVVLLVREAGAIVGLLHLGVRERAEEGDQPLRSRAHTVGVVRFFWYQRGHRAAGQALLDAAEEYWSAHPRTIVAAEAFHYDYTYPFYHVEHAYLSARLDHVHALLGLNDYHRAGSELVLDWPDFPEPDPGPMPRDVRLSRKWVPGEGQRPGLVLKANLRGRDVAVCVCASLGDVSRADAAQDWLYTRWLGVEADHQGRGLGRYLLLTALAEMRGAGYRHATICTFGDNYRAFLLYSNLGYHTVDWTYMFFKDLG